MSVHADKQALVDVEWWREWGNQFGWTLYGCGGMGEGNRESATFYDNKQNFHKVTGVLRTVFDAEIATLRSQLAEARAKAIEDAAQRALKARHESGANVALFAHGWDAGCAWCFNAIRSLSPTTPAQGADATPQPLDGVTVQDIVADNLILAQWLGEICQTFETLLGDIGHSAQSFERSRIEEARAVLNRLDYQPALSNPKPEE